MVCTDSVNLISFAYLIVGVTVIRFSDGANKSRTLLTGHSVVQIFIIYVGAVPSFWKYNVLDNRTLLCFLGRSFLVWLIPFPPNQKIRVHYFLKLLKFKKVKLFYFLIFCHLAEIWPFSHYHSRDFKVKIQNMAISQSPLGTYLINFQPLWDRSQIKLNKLFNAQNGQIIA